MDIRTLGKDIASPRLIVVKGVLFVVLGVLASGLLIAAMLIAPAMLAGWQVVTLHVVAVWAFCRAYYFAFYVIERYVDGRFRFAGVWSAVRWVVKRSALRQGEGVSVIPAPGPTRTRSVE